MTKNNTRKASTPAKKAEPKAVKEPEPMDPSIREEKVATPAPPKVRVCWALKMLVFEVADLFPETPVEFDNPDGRGTMLDATFDMTVLDAEDRGLLAALLELTKTDARVADVVSDASNVVVSIKKSARTQDLRDPFGLRDAFEILVDEWGPYAGWSL